VGLGIEAEGQSDLTEQIVEVFVKKAERTNADADEEKRLKPLVGSNQDKEFVVLLSLLILWSRGFGHVCRRPGACTNRHLILRQPLGSGSWIGEQQ
jgi:hypothetical protein